MGINISETKTQKTIQVYKMVDTQGYFNNSLALPTVDIRPMVTEDIVLDNVERCNDKFAKVARVDIYHWHLKQNGIL